MEVFLILVFLAGTDFLDPGNITELLKYANIIHVHVLELCMSGPFPYKSLLNPPPPPLTDRFRLMRIIATCINTPVGIMERPACIISTNNHRGDIRIIIQL